MNTITKLIPFVNSQYFSTPLLVDLKVGYCYVIEVADSKSDLGLHSKTLISKILLFLRIKMTKTI